MGRPTDDKKPSNLIVRVNDETKDRLRKEAKSKGITVSEYIRDIIALQNGSIVMQNENAIHIKESVVEQLQERIKELESQNTVLSLSYDTEIELKDTLRMIELSSSKEQVPLFLKNLHDRLESGEFQIENGKLKLGYTEVFEVLNRAETKKWLNGVWRACELSKKTYQEGLRIVFEKGAEKAIKVITGENDD